MWCVMMFRWINKQPGMTKVLKLMQSLSRNLRLNIITIQQTVRLMVYFNKVYGGGGGAWSRGMSN